MSITEQTEDVNVQCNLVHIMLVGTMLNLEVGGKFID